MDRDNDTKSKLREWIKLNLDIEKIKKQKKIMENKKKELDPIVKNFMEHQNIDELKVNNGTIVHKEKKKRETLSKKYIMKTLSTYLGNENKANDATQYLLEHREITMVDEVKLKLDK